MTDVSQDITHLNHNHFWHLPVKCEDEVSSEGPDVYLALWEKNLTASTLELSTSHLSVNALLQFHNRGLGPPCWTKECVVQSASRQCLLRDIISYGTGPWSAHISCPL